MIPRALEKAIRTQANRYAVILVTGPPEAGTTTLVRTVFPEHRYISMDNLEARRAASKDPVDFFESCGGNCIVDDVHRLPELVAHLKGFFRRPAEGPSERSLGSEGPLGPQVERHVERKEGAPRDTGPFVLAGAFPSKVLDCMPETIAANVGVFRLHPLTLNELYRLQHDERPSDIVNYRTGPSREPVPLAQHLLSGSYPIVHDRPQNAEKWPGRYLQDFIERDLASVLDIRDPEQFYTFLTACAGQSAQVLNLAALAQVTGVSQPTAKRWLSVLEDSGLVVMVPAYSGRTRKRLITSPKMYFIDTGVLAHLLQLRDERDLATSPRYPAVFETFVVTELIKRIAHTGVQPPQFHSQPPDRADNPIPRRPFVSHWRERNGRQIDAIIHLEDQEIGLQIRPARTFTPEFGEVLTRWVGSARATDPDQARPARWGLIVYRGAETLTAGVADSGVPDTGVPDPPAEASVIALPWWALYRPV